MQKDQDAFVYHEVSVILNYLGYVDGLPICFFSAGISPPSVYISLSFRILLANSPKGGRSRDNHHFWTLDFVSVAHRLPLTVLSTTKEKPPIIMPSCVHNAKSYYRVSTVVALCFPYTRIGVNYTNFFFRNSFLCP